MLKQSRARRTEWARRVFRVVALGLLSAPTFLRVPPCHAQPAPPPASSVVDDPDRLRERIRSLSSQKRLPEAIVAAEQMVRLQTRRLGPEDEQTGIALWGLGALWRMSGNSEQAIGEFRRAWLVFEKHPGQKSTLLWAALTSLESIYVARRDVAQLRPIYERELEITETVFGPNAEKTADVMSSLAWVHHALHDEAPAESYFRRAVEAQRRAKGASDPSVAGLLTDLAMYYAQVGNKDSEIGALREALAILEQAPKAEARDYAGCMNRLATLLVDRSDFEQAEPLFMRAATQYERMPGPASVGAAYAWANAAMIREHQQDYRGAETLLVQARAKFDSALGPNDPRSAIALNHLAALYAARSDYVHAEEAYQQLIAIHEHAKDAVSLADALDDLATMQLNRGQWQPAEAGLKRALSVLQAASQIESAHAVKILSNFATFHLKRGDLAQARSMAERAESIAEAKLDPSNRERGYAAVILAGVYKDSGDYRRAQGLYLRAEQVWRKAGGNDAPELALSHINLAELYHQQGDYRQAEPLLLEALEISKKAKDRGRHNVLAALNGLSTLYSEQGEYQRAAPYAEEVLQAWEQAGAELPGTGLAHANLGQIYVGRHDYERARLHLDRALAIDKKNADPQAAAQVLLALAGVRNLADDWPGAEAAYRDVIEQVKPFSSVSAKLATAHALGGIASMRLARGDLVAAEAMTRNALNAANVAGPGNPMAVASALGLAQLLTIKKDFAGAERLLQQTERALEKAAGKEHPALAEVLFGRALVQWSQANAAGAFQTLAEGLDIQERQLTRTLSIGSEEQRGLLLQGFDLGGEPAVALHASAYRAEPAAMRLAMLSILRRKGRLLDTVSNTTRVLRAHLSDADAALLEELRASRGAIAARAIASGNGSATSDAGANEIASLVERADALEAQIASRSSLFQAAVQPITLERIAAAIPADAVLVEIASYRPIAKHAVGVEKMWGARRYVAYALRPDGSLQYADLGDAQAIDDASSSFRAALSRPGSDAKPTGRALDELVMRPIRQIVGNVRHLLLAPDGALNVVPFAALVDEQGSYLIENWRISYLSTGRDLVRPKDIEPRSSAVVIANPAFGGSEDSAGDLGQHLEPLAFTEEEGRQVAVALGGGEPWLQAAANKHALMQTQGPWVLHVATHGFFLDDVQAPTGTARGFFRTGSQQKPQNPLLRSGLAFAGANLAGGDGILTSLEASSLDLWGTKLVVLSACDTGVGEIKNGEGIYGLRRAFALAGAESIVMSLWMVDDEGTRDLMKAYYTRLARGEGRADALRSAQLSLSHSAQYSDPWHWASFVEYGGDGPLGAPVALPAARTPIHPAAPGPPPVRASAARLGCGCSTAGRSSRSLDAALLMMMSAALLRRRKKGRASDQHQGR
jgi:CHAT domain-containing protein/tetratricopeptide (TPR) repeat protein